MTDDDATTSGGPRAWLDHARSAWRDPARRREIVILGAIAAVGIAILGAGTLAIAVTRGGSDEPAADPSCVRWKINSQPVRTRTEIVGATSRGARCGDPLELGRIGREGPFRVVVDDDVLWTSRCPDGRNPYSLELSVDADGDLQALVRCPRVDDAGSGPAPRQELDVDALLRKEGYPAFLED